MATNIDYKINVFINSVREELNTLTINELLKLSKGTKEIVVDVSVGGIMYSYTYIIPEGIDYCNEADLRYNLENETLDKFNNLTTRIDVVNFYNWCLSNRLEYLFVDLMHVRNKEAYKEMYDHCNTLYLRSLSNKFPTLM